METLRLRLEEARRAFDAFTEAVTLRDPAPLARDAAIMRFVFTTEAVWKAARQLLDAIDGIDVGSPKGAIRALRRIGVLADDEAERAIKMIELRNLVVHVYKEQMAIAVWEQLPAFEPLLRSWLAAMEARARDA